MLIPFFRKHFFLLLFLLLPISFLLGCSLGSEFYSMEALFFPEGKFAPTLLAKSRLIQILAAFLAGSSLALAGAVYQAVLRNILAEPYILGVSSGSALGAALAFLTGGALLTPLALPLFAALGAILSLGMVLFLGFRKKGAGGNDLLLSGIIVGSILSSLLMALVSMASTKEMCGLAWWLLGDLAAVDPSLLFFFSLTTPLLAIFLFLLAPCANLLSLGEEYAYSMGINPKRNAFFLILFASLLVSQVVALAGIISFVGLIVPHIIRKLYRGDNRYLFPASFLGGGIYLILCDTLSRSIFPEREIPIGVITALAGGPLFLFLLQRKEGKNG